LSRQPRIGAENFIETKDGEMIVRGLVEVSPSDSRYLEAWRQEFERAGFYAEIADEKRARLWENIRGSEIDRDIQDQVVYGIQRLPDEAVRQIEKELEGLKKSSLSK
jgi:threonyl-tRNA synthetase